MTRLDRLGAECTKARPEFDPDEIEELCDHAQALADALRCGPFETFTAGDGLPCIRGRDFSAILAAFDEWNADR